MGPQTGQEPPEGQARWTKEHVRSYYGYNNHTGGGRRPKFARRYGVSGARVRVYKV